MYQEVWSVIFRQLSGEQKRHRQKLFSFDISSKGMYSSLLRFSMTFILTKYLENSSSVYRDFPFTVRNKQTKGKEIVCWLLNVPATC